MAQGFSNGSAAESIGNMIGSAVDKVAEGFRSPTPDSAKDAAAELAMRQGIPDPYAVMQPTPADPAALYPNIPAQDPQSLYTPVGSQNVPIGAPPQAAMQAQPAQPDTSQFMPSTYGQQPAKPVANPYEAEYNRILGQQQGANNALADAGKHKAVFEASKYQELAKQQEQSYAEAVARQQAIVKNTDAQIQSINQAETDYKNFLASPQAKVKTNNYWESKSTGQKVLAGIALFLGAAGGSITGKNPVIDIMSKAIDQDIDAQKTNIRLQAEGKLQNYSMKNNMYAQMMSKYKNEEQATAAVQLLKLEQLKSQFNAVASDYSGSDIEAKRQMANSFIDQQKLQAKMQFAAAAKQKEILGALGMSGEAQAINALPKELQEKYVPGYGVATNKESAQEFQKVRAGLEPVVNAIDSLVPRLQKLNRVTDPKQKAALQTEIAALAGKLRLPITGPGAMTEDEYKRLRDLVGDPTKLFSVRAWELAKMSSVKNMLNRDLDASASQYGLTRKNMNLPLKTLGPAK